MSCGDEDDIQRTLNILAAGINRFYTEGYVRWSRENVQKVLGDKINIESPCVQSALQAWAKAGIIHLLRTEEEYFVVLRPLPTSSQSKDSGL